MFGNGSCICRSISVGKAYDCNNISYIDRTEAQTGIMNYTFDTQEMFARIIKYLIEGFAIAIVALLLPSQKLEMEEAFLLALVAATVFALLDLVSPSISSAAHTGIGYGIGLNLIPIL